MDEVCRLREIAPGVHALELQRAMDISGAPEVKDYLLGLVDRGFHRLVVNLDGVAHMDSSGLEALSSAYMKILAVGGKLFLICSNPRITRLFSRVGWEDIMRSFASEEEIIEFLNSADIDEWYESF